MKLETINERINNAKAKLEKKSSTIQKKLDLIERKKEKLNKAGFAYTSEGKAATKELYHGGDGTWFWLFLDIESLEDDVTRLQKEVKEISQKLEEYSQVQCKSEIESNILKSIPDSLKGMQNELVERWDKYDLDLKARIWSDYKSMDYKSWLKKWRREGSDLMHKSDADIHKENVKTAESLILSLIYRVKDIVGEITNWSDIRVTSGAYGPVLNGWVGGTEGRAAVESIIAGGPIQRTHIRTLVKELN